jgi:hypothetical protein
MTQDTPADLPPVLREALLAEIDPGETLRWCGQPDSARVAARTLAAAYVLALLFGGFFGGMALFAGYSTRAELLSLAAGDETVRAWSENRSWSSVWFSLALGWTVIAAGLAGPPLLTWNEVRKARRTVYALTGTRVFTLLVGRAGRARVHSVEPGHPLSLSRTDHSDGRGDITLHSSAAAASRGPSMRLIGVADARHVERLIRATFDPPTGSASAKAAP